MNQILIVFMLYIRIGNNGFLARSHHTEQEYKSVEKGIGPLCTNSFFQRTIRTLAHTLITCTQTMDITNELPFLLPNKKGRGEQ